MSLKARIAKHKNILAVGAATLSVGLFGAAAFAFYQSETAAPTPAAAAEPAATAEPTTPPALAPDTAKKHGDALKQAIGDLTKSAAAYLGLQPQDLMAQLKAGKSLAQIADATPGKSRDGLVAALTDAANKNIDAAVASGKLNTDQAAMAKQKLPALIGKLVERSGTHK